jgi:3-hydroxy-9,10-secoandrosta-1,3,5(10)-triene-9,17-dione monooxygenase reductase component
MARWATGVSVVTARDGDGDAGLTVNALLSVSLEPPSLLVSLSADADTLPVLKRSGRFGVSLLAADQQGVSERFARTLPRAEKFTGLLFHRGPRGSALLGGALAAVECRLASTIPAFDHVLVIGEVEFAELGADGPPLLYFRSGYGIADGAGAVRLPPSRP